MAFQDQIMETGSWNATQTDWKSSIDKLAALTAMWFLRWINIGIPLVEFLATMKTGDGYEMRVGFRNMWRHIGAIFGGWMQYNVPMLCHLLLPCWRLALASAPMLMLTLHVWYCHWNELLPRRPTDEAQRFVTSSISFSSLTTQFHQYTNYHRPSWTVCLVKSFHSIHSTLRYCTLFRLTSSRLIKRLWPCSCQCTTCAWEVAGPNPRVKLGTCIRAMGRSS